MIKTLTLNPTLDRHLYLSSFTPGGQNRAVRESVEAGGKGVNVSRAITALNGESKAFAAVGEYGSDEYLRLCGESGLSPTVYTVAGQRIRTNTVLHPDGQSETGISTDSFFLKDEELNCIFDLLSPTSADTVAVSGRLPKGLSKQAIKAFLNRIKATGARLSLDSGSFSYAETVAAAPFFIKPNRTELAALGFYLPEDSVTEATLKAAEELYASGVENVLVTLDGDGGVYAGSDGLYVISVPRLAHPVSTVGAGDSTVAGFLTAFQAGLSLPEVLKRAFAAGTAACMTEGTLPPRLSDVKELEAGIKVTNI